MIALNWTTEVEGRDERRGEEWTELDALGSSPDGRPAHYVTYLHYKCVCGRPDRVGPAKRRVRCQTAVPACLGAYYLLPTR
jgi:hypothetical protein